MSVFNELLRIKVFRERKAETEVSRARSEVQLRIRDHEAAQHALEAWRMEAVERELALYADLCRRIVKLREIEEVQVEVSGFRQVEYSREDAVAQAEQRMQAAREEMTLAAKRLLEASRMREKFVDLADDYAQSIRLEEERKEELELEEAASTMHQREALEDWEARQHD